MKKIRGFNYYVDKKGIVYNENKHALSPYVSGNGYKKVTLCKDGRHYKFYVHRLVAITYIKTYSKRLQVNHKNLIKNDNRLSNLEWLTRKNNMKHYKENR